MVDKSETTKTLRARELSVSRQSFYYKQKKPDQDWQLKCRIEAVLREYPSYGSRRLAIHLHLNRKRVKRVMNIFGIKAYRRRGLKWKKTKNIKVIYDISDLREPHLGRRFYSRCVSGREYFHSHRSRSFYEKSCRTVD